MIAAFIVRHSSHEIFVTLKNQGEIGIFTKEGMDSFGQTFVQHQIIGHSPDNSIYIIIEFRNASQGSRLQPQLKG
jgi:hypothetical protein